MYKTAQRLIGIQHKYGRVPYLNSSLFEIGELEDQTIKINSLDNGQLLDLIGISILKDPRKKTDRLPTLDYLFQFLDAYDFASEGTEDVQEENKSIINASVLGKVFEKIDGYIGRLCLQSGLYYDVHVQAVYPPSGRCEVQ